MTARNVDAFDVKSSIQENAVRRLILSGLLLIAAIAVMTAAMVGSFRERALNTIERQLENTVLLLANTSINNSRNSRSFKKTSSHT